MSEIVKTTEHRGISRYMSWKRVFVFLSLPILMNILFEIIELCNFNTFDNDPTAKMFDNIFMYGGNWPSLLLKKYPYVIAGGGEVVYEVSGWMEPIPFIINLIGWGLVGFIGSYAIGKLKEWWHINTV